MATITTAIISPTNKNHLNPNNYVNQITKNGAVFPNKAAIFSGGSWSLSTAAEDMLVKFPIGRRPIKRNCSFLKPFSPVMQWQDYKVQIEVDVPASVAYNCYSDREATPQWMTTITSVKILENNPDLSRWTMKYNVLGHDMEFSWLARNMQPIRNQKIHWRSVDDVLPNRGAVRFFPKSDSSCVVELTVSYQVPQILLPVASALRPFTENVLVRGLQKFAEFVKTYHVESAS